MDDTICACGHWFEEHDSKCNAPGCECLSFTYSTTESSPQAIADRGGDPDLWPERVKQALDH